MAAMISVFFMMSVIRYEVLTVLYAFHMATLLGFTHEVGLQLYTGYYEDNNFVKGVRVTLVSAMSSSAMRSTTERLIRIMCVSEDTHPTMHANPMTAPTITNLSFVRNPIMILLFIDYLVVSTNIATRLKSFSEESLSVAPRPSIVMRSAAILYFLTKAFFTTSARFSESFWLNSALPSGEA